jgi:hypothetical protein
VLFVVPLHRHHQGRRAQVHRLGDRLEARRRRQPPAALHHRQEFLAVERVKGERLVVALDLRRAGAVPEAVQPHAGVAPVPADDFLGVAAVQEVHQEKRILFDARPRRRGGQFLAQERRHHDEALVAPVGNRVERKRQPLFRPQLRGPHEKAQPAPVHPPPRRKRRIRRVLKQVLVRHAHHRRWLAAAA